MISGNKRILVISIILCNGIVSLVSAQDLESSPDAENLQRRDGIIGTEYNHHNLQKGRPLNFFEDSDPAGQRGEGGDQGTGPAGPRGEHLVGHLSDSDPAGQRGEDGDQGTGPAGPRGEHLVGHLSDSARGPAGQRGVDGDQGTRPAGPPGEHLVGYVCPDCYSS